MASRSGTSPKPMPRHGSERSPGRYRRSRMTTLLTTPAGWPRTLLARFGAVDPTDLDAAARAGAFAGLKHVINNLGQTGVTALIASANLRGRGGAGYPAAEKWRVAAAQDADVKYVVANGYGADPAAFTDRS